MVDILLPILFATVADAKAFAMCLSVFIQNFTPISSHLVLVSKDMSNAYKSNTVFPCQTISIHCCFGIGN